MTTHQESSPYAYRCSVWVLSPTQTAQAGAGDARLPHTMRPVIRGRQPAVSSMTEEATSTCLDRGWEVGPRAVVDVLDGARERV